MKKMIYVMLGLTIITAGFFIFPNEASAGVAVNINVDLCPPPMMAKEPSEIVLSPRYGVYFVPNVKNEIFFDGGMWWSRSGNIWYRSESYRNGWEIVADQEVPEAVFNVPKGYFQRLERENNKGHGSDPMEANAKRQ